MLDPTRVEAVPEIPTFTEEMNSGFAQLETAFLHWTGFDWEPTIKISFIAPIGFHVRIEEAKLPYPDEGIEERMYDSDVWLPVGYDNQLDEQLDRSDEQYVLYRARSVHFSEEKGLFVATTIDGKYRLDLSRKSCVRLRSDWLE